MAGSFIRVTGKESADFAAASDVDVDVERSRLRQIASMPVFNIQHTITNIY